MENVLKSEGPFDYAGEGATFKEVFDLAHRKLGETAFVRYRGGQAVGGLAPAYFEAISMGILETRDVIRGKSDVDIRSAITGMIESQRFRDVTGPGANSRTKLRRKIELATNALHDA